jgi:exopolysaccharide biosynthesis polyprenyl glycosylphosphotransferase
MSDTGADLRETVDVGTHDAVGTQEPSRPLRRLWLARLPWAGMALAVDVTMLVAALVVTELVSPEHVMSILAMTVFAVLVIAQFQSRGMYRPPLRLHLVDTIRAVVTVAGISFAIVVTLRVLVGESQVSAHEAVLLGLFATLLLVGGRASLVLSERRARIAGEAGYPTLIVGAGNVGRTVAARLRAEPEIGLRPVGFLDKEPLQSGEQLPDLPVLGASWDLEQVIADHGIEHVIVTFSTAPTDVLLGVLRRCERLGIRTSSVPRLYERSTEQLTVESIGGIPLLTGHSPRPKSWQFAVKHGLDRVTAGLALIVLSPVFAVCAVTVYLSLGRPLFYGAERVGRDGRKFDMLKFRTMHGRPVTDADQLEISSETGTSGADEAARLTRAGAFLRTSSLDELPQLLNVLKGDMSLVGPRPERTEYVEVLEHSVHRYDERHRVKSGITGWAQVNGLRGQTSLADRVEWDNYYIQNWSFWLDFKIVLRTFTTVLGSQNAE